MQTRRVQRSQALAPLSRDHHQALETALRLRRADDDTLDSALARLSSFWAGIGRRHFEIEEELLLPALADERWLAMAERVRSEHADIRRRAAALEEDASVDAARELGERLNAHVRFEERELFGHLETALDTGELERLGRAVEEAEGTG
jgi:hemerythrin-like domain-containing protein